MTREPRDDELVAVYETPATTVARIIVSLLESEGIPAVQQPELLPEQAWDVTGDVCVRVMVPSTFAERSAELIGAFRSADVPDSGVPESAAEPSEGVDDVLRRMQRG